MNALTPQEASVSSFPAQTKGLAVHSDGFRVRSGAPRTCPGPPGGLCGDLSGALEGQGGVFRDADDAFRLWPLDDRGVGSPETL